MKTLQKKIGKNNYSIESFDSVLEMANTNKTRVVTEAWKGREVTKDVDKSWTGATYEEAYELLSGGWEEQTKKVASLVDKVSKTGMKTKITFNNQVEGFVPNVALSLLNVPQAMINMTRTVQKSKVINVVYDNGVSCCVSMEEIIKAGLNLVNAIVNLEMSGYRVDLSVIDFFVDGSAIDGCMVKVKNSNQTLNLKKMMFPLAHSAWQRVIGFDWQDKTPFNRYMGGRGRPYYASIRDGNCKADELKQIIGDNTVYLNYEMTKKGQEEIERILTSK